MRQLWRRFVRKYHRPFDFLMYWSMRSGLLLADRSICVCNLCRRIVWEHYRPYYFRVHGSLCGRFVFSGRSIHMCELHLGSLFSFGIKHMRALSCWDVFSCQCFELHKLQHW